MTLYGRTFGRFNYKVLMAVPLALTLLFVPLVMNLPLGIDFTGGSEVQAIVSQVSAPNIDASMKQCASDVSVSTRDLGDKIIIIAKTKQELDADCVWGALISAGVPEEEAKRILPSTFKPELGRTLIESGTNVFIIAVSLMVIIVFIAFRTFVPSIAVILAALCDIVLALGLMTIFGIELNLAGVAALLMLVGYSVDSDIMLTSRMLKQTTKSVEERIDDAFTTGLTMSGTTIGAMFAIILMTTFLQMAALSQIAFVIFFGLIADVITTWMMNVGILKWYIESGAVRRAKPRLGFTFFRS